MIYRLRHVLESIHDADVAAGRTPLRGIHHHLFAQTAGVTVDRLLEEINAVIAARSTRIAPNSSDAEIGGGGK